MKKPLFFVLFFFSLTVQSLAQSPCNPNPSLTEMSQEYHDFLQNEVKPYKIRIAVFPFQDGSLIDLDPTLEKGFAFSLYDFLRLSPKIGVYHPFVVLDAADKLSFSSADLFNSQKIIEAAKSIGATHAVYGMFQKQGAGLRFFVKTTSVDPAEPLGPVMEFASEQSDRFFSIAADTAKRILELIGKQKLNEEFLKQKLKEKPSFESFRYYIKGIEKSRFYDETALSVAKVWFEKATTLSYAFTQAYNDTARTLFMTALLERLKGKDSSILWAEGQSVLRQAHLTSKNKNSDKKNSEGAYRWLDAHLLFAEGVSQLEAHNFKKAQTALSQTAELLPEDGLAHYFLSKAYEQLKNPKTSKEKEWATRLGICGP